MICSAPDKEIALNMSSMVKHLISVSALIFPATVLAAPQQTPPIQWQQGTGSGSIVVPPSQVDPSKGNIPAALQRWRMLNQNGNYSFGEYASFLMTYPGWPNAKGMQQNAEQAIDLNSYSPSQTVAFFDRLPPVSNSGRAKYAIALAAAGDKVRAEQWARRAWREGALTDADEALILGMMAGKLTSDDHDTRVDKLLWIKATRAAERILPYTSPGRRAGYASRIALKNKTGTADSFLSQMGSAANADAGVLADRALAMRAQGSGSAARELLANRKPLSKAPADPEEWYGVMLTLAREAANDGQYETAYKIASRVDDGLPAGAPVIEQSLGVRDDYTSLTWLAGTIALERLNRPKDAVAMFERYGNGAKSPQTRTKGLYWAGRAAKRAGDTVLANSYFEKASVYYDQFYGQLATEALGRPLTAIAAPATIPAKPSTDASSVFQAARLIPRFGDHKEQTLFLRAIANSAVTEQNFIDAISLSKSIGRPDLSVMAGRNARVEGFSSLIPYGFPTISVPAGHKDNWTMIHAISRQESQFDREALSHAGARGLMQLMPGTARETAGKLSLSYQLSSLTTDPDYNIQLGSTYFQRMLSYYGGSYPLAVAAYNAGPGNVNKWLKANGDPRTGSIGMLEWIERIPIYETKNYVHRVLENAVVYDLQHPDKATKKSPTPLSSYLGKSTPG
jgi:soluble lytic murein transglycosylase